ncbi:retrovirus-related pol polyprotein from transposon TNT 1-94 [Tanacetum coccineum]
MTSKEYTNCLLSAEDRYKGRGYDKGQEAEQKHVKIMEERIDKVVNMAAGDSYDALVYCIENMIEDRIMDYGASFHATYCKEEFERFKLRSDLKRRLISVGQLDEEGYHVGFRDKQWKVTKGSLVVAHGNKRGSLYMVEVHPEGIGAIIDSNGSATLWFEEVEEAFLHNVKEDKETAETATGVAIVMLKMVPETPLQFGVAERLSRTFRARGFVQRLERSTQMKCDTSFGIRKVTMSSKAENAKSAKCTFIGYGSYEMGYRFWDSKSHKVVQSIDVTFNKDSLYGAKVATDSSNLTKANQKDQVGAQIWVRGPKTIRASRIVEDQIKKTLKIEHPSRREVSRLHSYEDPSVESRAPVKVKDVCGEAMKCTFIGSGSDEVRYSFQDTKSHQVIQSKDITFVDSIYGARSATNSSSLTKPIQTSQVVLVDIPDNLAENDSIVAEHGLSSEITKSPGRSSDTSERSENSGSFEDSGRSDEEYSEDEASSKEGGSETPHVRRSTEESNALVRIRTVEKAINEEMVSLEKNQTYSLVRISAGKKASQSVQVFEMKDRCSEKQVLGYVLTVGIKTVEWESGLQKSITMVLIFVEASWNEEPCRDVHQVGDEREVKVLRNFNWPPSELITEDGVLPERGYSQFNDVSLGYLDTLYRKSPSPVFGWCSVFRMFSGTESLARGVQFSTGSAVWHDRAVWHESEQFSSELNNISLV